MGDDLTELDFTDARIEEVRNTVKALMQQDGLTQQVIARETDIGVSTLAAVLSGSYTGNTGKQALLLQRWISGRLAKASLMRAVPAAPEFQRTPTAEAFCSVFEYAQFTPDISVIVGNPGLGKTTAARAYKRLTLNVWMLTCLPDTSGSTAIVQEVATAIGVNTPEQRSNPFTNAAIIRRLRGLHALLIVDEAQNLNTKALEQLRGYHDLGECGIVLMGNNSIFRRLEGGTRSADFAQLYSRVGMRVDRKRPLASDIEMLLDAWGIQDKAVRRIARAVARKPGALRAMTKVLRQAHARASRNDGVLTEAHMIAAAQQLLDDKPLEFDA